MKTLIRKVVPLLLSFCCILGYSIPGNAVVVDLLVTYDDSSRRYFNDDVETAMLNWVAQSNDMYEASGVDIQLRLAGVRQYDFNASSMGQALDYITNNPTLVDWRREFGADFITQLHDVGSCGIGWVAVNESYAWNVVGPDCGAYTLIHELGHNMGLTHSRRQGDTSGSWYRYGLGYGVDGLFSTIMAYSSAFGARRIGLFSHPGLDCRGAPCGIPAGQSQEADAHRALNNVASEVAGFRGDVIPSTTKSELTKPTPGSTISGSTVTLEWSEPQGASAYDLLLGTTGPGSTDIRSSAILYDTASLTVNNLPTNGETIYVRLWTQNDGWKYNDYSFQTSITVDSFTTTMTVIHSGLCAGFADADNSNGESVVQKACDQSESQTWQFEPVAGKPDTYFVRSTASNLCLDVSGASTADGGNVIQWNCHGGANQQWRFSSLFSLADGYSWLESVQSGKCLHVENANYNEGGNIVQQECLLRANQVWYIPN